MAGNMRRLFKRLFHPVHSRKRAARHVRSEQRLAESLERRLAMAVDVAFVSPSEGDGDRWATLLVNEGDEAFMQVVSSQTLDLRVANNAGFFNSAFIRDVNQRVDDVYVLNGTVVERSVSFPDDANRFGLPIGYPTSSDIVERLQFTLPTESIDTRERITAELDLGDGGQPIRFENIQDDRGNFTAQFRTTSGPTVGVSLSNTSFNDFAIVEVSLAGGFRETLGSERVPTLDINYDSDNTFVFSPGGDAVSTTTRVRESVGAVFSPGGQQSFNLFDRSTHQYVPGTLTGEIMIDFAQLGATLQAEPLVFQVDTAAGEGNVPITFGNDQFKAYWADQGDAAEPRSTVAELLVNSREADGDPQTGMIQVSGSFNASTGRLTLFTTTASNTTRSTTGDFFPNPARRAGIPIWLDKVSIGLRDLTPSDDAGDPQGTTFNSLPTGVTLFPGHNFSQGLTVEMSPPGSSISIESPIVTGASTSGVVSLAASEVRMSAPVRAESAVVVPSTQASRFQTTTEQFVVEAAVGSPIFDVSLADDPLTGGLARSRFHVTQTGSLSNVLNVLAPINPNNALQLAANIAVEVEGGDVVVEGQIAGQSQTYTLRSLAGSETEGPYSLTTTSSLTGRDTGLLRGDTIVITLANDTLGQTGFEAFGTLVSNVSLQTEVDRLRVQAGARAGSSGDVPFPYALRINEADDLILDAVAATSDNIVVEAKGKLDLLAALSSVRDIALIAGDAFTVSSPISSALGKIEVTAPTISVRNSVRVYNAYTQEDRQDIVFHATNGPLEINDAVTAINGVSLRAQGAGGDVSGQTRVISDIVTIEADGAVDLATEANLVEVTASGRVKVAEQTAAVFEVRESPDVSLSVGGQDFRKSDGSVSPAMYADVYGAEQISVSALSGSIDLLRIGDSPLLLGDRDAIIGNTNPEPMVAAGSVVIRADRATQIRVTDAPVAASNAEQVRFATTLPFPPAPASVFTPSRLAGIYPSELSTRLVMDDGKIPAINNVRAADLRLGDRILIKDGIDGYSDPETGLENDAIVNGIYAIRAIEFINSAQLRLVLRRATDHDSTEEIGGRHYIRVTDGAAGSDSTRGKVFLSDGFENIDPTGEWPTPFKVEAVVPQAGAVAANAITTRPLDAVYSPESQTLTAVNAGPIRGITSSFDGVGLRTNDLVLVRDVAGDDPAAVGLYRVSRDGTASSSDKWVLSRYTGFDETGDGSINTMYTGLVSLLDGTLKTRVTGQMYEITYDSINRAPLPYREITNFRNDDEQLLNPGAVLFDPNTSFQTVIGTASPFGQVVYEVTSEAGVNSAAGSLGKMLQLVQSNAAFIESNGERRLQAYSTEIADNVTRVELLQALPVINRPVTLLSEAGLVLDGTRISSTSDGGIVRAGGISRTLFPVKPSTAKSSRRLVRDAGVVGTLDEVHGIEVGPGGRGTIISQISVGGFRNGAAIKIAGADGVLVEDVVLGVAPDGSGKANKYGLLVEQVSNANNGRDTTLLNSLVAGNTEAGVQLSSNSAGVKLVGNQIGFDGRGNGVGVVVDNLINESNIIGIPSVLPSQVVSGLRITPSNLREATVPKNSVTDVFQAGLELYDRQANRKWSVSNIEEDGESSYRLRFTSDSPMFANDEIGSSVSVEAGYFANVSARAVRIRLPSGVGPDKVYLGQEVRSTVAGVFRAGTKILSIDREDGEIFLQLTEPAAASAVTGLLFEVPGRNVIESNLNGVVLESGASKMAASDIQRSVFDGVRINGVAEDGKHVIGSSLGTRLSRSNVSLNANGQSGINFTSAFFEQLGTTEEKLARAEQVVIQGNFLGTNVAQLSGLSNGGDGQSNIIFGKASDGSDPSARIREELLIGPDPENPDAPENRSADGRYIAKYRPEDNPSQLRELEEFESLDLEGNLHFVGDPADLGPGGGGFTGSEDDWMIDPPIRR